MCIWYAMICTSIYTGHFTPDSSEAALMQVAGSYRREQRVARQRQAEAREVKPCMERMVSQVTAKERMIDYEVRLVSTVSAIVAYACRGGHATVMFYMHHVARAVHQTQHAKGLSGAEVWHDSV